MLAVTGGKGGTGKTTTALGLAVALAERRRDPIVLDADVDMPNLHIRAGTDDSGLTALAAGTPIEEAATPAERYPGVSIVGATPGTDLERALRQVRTDRPVILDGAAGADERAVTPLRHADAAVVVARQTPAAVTDSVKSIRMSRAVDAPVAGAILSRAADVPASVEKALGVEPLLPIPSVSDPIAHEQARVAYDRLLDEWANA
ncbi:P-loop NTPase [Halodesulfurarchaeum sp. HSR-GB]|uniref:MinD/ParA family ATP-binding protein n=1 Tax=Halodesulfurarchaeum sp. HSR-GB TaxID=3074077 RepID=UPI002864D959|nr:P-loop NTPase [Halodesulfurarchaeum sp. HSR-GB]MDR5655581.1 P-loop NTPase [Halodesulfurarchaeum sp. HSR-GB]